ncbi:hypothetical protein [Microbacterium oleivorans]|uniref:Uncharacterized protein n=1 Tax=Microbacterium oleivorans TaxID=273677 RepID=A0A177KA36_9MICO|nr:hypothetical protein [Microbacterium oleivorans]OAH50279.1 hypothetical protein AYL44_07385 [Microbacterium oleivorans]
MSTTPALLLDLTGVARLAGVRRPVASMWRSRFASTVDPFPAPVADGSGRPRFEAEQVADWLVRTGHGNNPEARGDAAAAAAPSDFSFSDAGAVAELQALVALHAQVEDLDELTPSQIEEAAANVDPLDLVLRREIAAHLDRGARWVTYATCLVDAAYSPAAALALIARRHAASNRAAGSAGPLVADAIDLVVDAAVALAGGDATVTLDAGDAALSSTVASRLGASVNIVLPAGADSRRVRRHLLVEGHWIDEAADPATGSVVVARVPSVAGADVAGILRALDEVSLSLRDSDAGVVIGPARALVDPLTPTDERARTDILRSGRVRGIARLSTGLVDSAVRESLALWILGEPTFEVAPAQRITAVADLTGVQLTPATRADLISDLMAGMGTAHDLRAHQFRFAAFVRTASLQARSGSLVASVTRKPAATTEEAAELPALLDIAAEAVRADLAPIEIAPEPHDVPRAASVAELIRDGHVRRIQGTRLHPDLLGSEGLVVVTASDLDEPASIGRTRVDQFAFATQHPSAQLTRPGDVIFRTSPTAAAWVDPDGSKVVAYPARVLRITAADPGGLVPEIIAADITGAPAGPGAWKRWTLRRVATRTMAPLRQAIADIAAARRGLEARAARLTDYANLMVAGATSGAVTMIDLDHAADAAETQ